MVAQRFDHAAIGRDPAAAPADNAREFVAQQRQLRDLFLDLFQMRGRDPVGFAAVARGSSDKSSSERISSIVKPRSREWRTNASRARCASP
jgi:hypothetical protein